MTSPATPQRDSDRVRVPPVTTTPRRHALKRRNTVFRAAALMSLYNSPLAPGVKPACKARKKGKPKRQENTTSKYGTTCVLCFGGLDPQKQGHLQKKKGSFGFQVYVISQGNHKVIIAWLPSKTSLFEWSISFCSRTKGTFRVVSAQWFNSHLGHLLHVCHGEEHHDTLLFRRQWHRYQKVA